jgi:hypothetical protein
MLQRRLRSRHPSAAVDTSDTWRQNWPIGAPIALWATDTRAALNRQGALPGWVLCPCVLWIGAIADLKVARACVPGEDEQPAGPGAYGVGSFGGAPHVMLADYTDAERSAAGTMPGSARSSRRHPCARSTSSPGGQAAGALARPPKYATPGKLPAGSASHVLTDGPFPGNCIHAAARRAVRRVEPHCHNQESSQNVSARVGCETPEPPLCASVIVGLPNSA